MALRSPHKTDIVRRDDEGTDFGPYRIFPRLRILMRNGVKIEIGPLQGLPTSARGLRRDKKG